VELVYPAQYPRNVLLDPVELVRPASLPINVLLDPEELVYPASNPRNVLEYPVELVYPAFIPRNVLEFPVELVYPAQYPINALLNPVVLYRPAFNPKNTLVFEFPPRISQTLVPELFVSTVCGVDAAVIDFIDTTIVPLKSLVGVIWRASVLVAIGPHAPLAEIDDKVCPPNVIVNVPAVLPVTVYVIWYNVPLIAG